MTTELEQFNWNSNENVKTNEFWVFNPNRLKITKGCGGGGPSQVTRTWGYQQTCHQGQRYCNINRQRAATMTTKSINVAMEPGSVSSFHLNQLHFPFPSLQRPTWNKRDNIEMRLSLDKGFIIKF